MIILICYLNYPLFCFKLLSSKNTYILSLELGFFSIILCGALLRKESNSVLKFPRPPSPLKKKKPITNTESNHSDTCKLYVQLHQHTTINAPNHLDEQNKHLSVKAVRKTHINFLSNYSTVYSNANKIYRVDNFKSLYQDRSI